MVQCRVLGKGTDEPSLDDGHESELGVGGVMKSFARKPINPDRVTSVGVDLHSGINARYTSPSCRLQRKPCRPSHIPCNWRLCPSRRPLHIQCRPWHKLPSLHLRKVCHREPHMPCKDGGKPCTSLRIRDCPFHNPQRTFYTPPHTPCTSQRNRRPSAPLGRPSR